MQDQKVALVAKHVSYRFPRPDKANSVPFPVIAGTAFAKLDARGVRFSDLTCTICRVNLLEPICCGKRKPAVLGWRNLPRAGTRRYLIIIALPLPTVLSGERIDFLKVDTEGFDLEVVKGLESLRPAVLQTEFWGDEFIFMRTEKNRADFVSSAEIIRELRKREPTVELVWRRLHVRLCYKRRKT